MSKILVTGGTGFIGYHLVKRLSEVMGHNVTVVDNMSRGKNINPGVNFRRIDLTDKGKFRKLGKDYDFVFHLAAVNGTKNFYKGPFHTSKTNLLTTINILDWMKEKSPNAKLIWTSSSEVYAGTPKKKIPTPENINLTINNIHNPRFSYATSKIACESMVLNHPIESVVVRPHNIYGPRMGFDHVISELIYKFITFREDCNQAMYDLDDPNNTRAFCYIDDFIIGLLTATFFGENKEIYNIGNDKEEIKIYDLAHKILSIMDKKIIINKGGELPGSVKRRCPDISKMRKLGYEPKVNLDEGLKETYRWIRS